MKLGLMLSAALLLTGCSTIPEPINTSDDTSLASYQGVANNPEQFVGQQARWGGVIADVRNSEDYTIIEMVNFPLKSWGRPTVGDDSDGRFLALIDGFIDPAVYEQGRSLTILGTVQEVRTGKIDDYTYTYPVLEASGYYLWKKEKPRVETQIDFAPLWFRHNFYAPYPYRPYYVPRPVVRPSNNSGSPDKSKQ